MIVCDSQGCYHYDPCISHKCHFELTNVAICSCQQCYGITDMGEKGIESFLPTITATSFVTAMDQLGKVHNYNATGFNQIQQPA